MNYADRLKLAMQHRTPPAQRKDLAAALGISVQALGLVLRGESKSLTAENNAAAAKYLGVNPTWLATNEGEMLSLAVNNPLLVDPTIPVRKVKLIKLEAVGMYLETLNDVDVPATEYCGVATAGPRTFAVEAPDGVADIPTGSVLLIDPDETPRANDWVLATQDGHNVIKRVMRDGADLYLASPIKPRPLDSVTVIGVAVGFTVRWR